MESDERIVQKLVTDIVEKNAGILNPKEDPNKFSKMVPSLMKKGIDNLNLSMFNHELKFNILSALGEEYRRKGNLSDAVKTFVLAGNQEKLNQVARQNKRTEEEN